MNFSVKSAKNEGYLEQSHHFFHLRDTAGQERDFHFHEFDKIVILISGHVDYAVENNIYSLRPWNILLIPHHTIHKALIDKSEPYERIIIYLSSTYYSGILPEAGITSCLDRANESGGYLLFPDSSQISDIADILHRYKTYSGGKIDAMRDILIVQLLIQLGSLTEEPNHETVTEKHDVKIEQVLSYINENLTENLSVDELADMVYLSKYHFMRLFKENTGSSVHAYVRQRRLMHASRLIRSGVPAVQAAQRSGFEDYSVFYRAFKNNFGTTPGELKK